MGRPLAILGFVALLSVFAISCDDGEDELVLARWRPAASVDAQATQLTVEVLDPEWSCGVPVLRRIVDSKVIERDDSIEVEIRLEPIFRDHAFCDAPVESENLVIDLERGVGDRELVGAGPSWPPLTDE